jgi:hypothetical protein
MDWTTTTGRSAILLVEGTKHFHSGSSTVVRCTQECHTKEERLVLSLLIIEPSYLKIVLAHSLVNSKRRNSCDG